MRQYLTMTGAFINVRKAEFLVSFQEMKVLDGVRDIQSPLKSSVLTIGNFDGVHLAHQELISRVVSRAKERSEASVVMTFEPHPMKVLHPDRKFHRIFDLEDQRQQMESLGVDLLVIEPFSREFSQETPERFLQEWVVKPFTPSSVIVGYDFSFGADRGGSIEYLEKNANSFGFEAVVMPPLKVSGVIVSSTRIRSAIETGDVAFAQTLLGRYFYINGIVERGAGRGRTIGIPTANLHTSAELIPARGVYCGWFYVNGLRRKCVVNVGVNPTFKANTSSPAHPPLSIEAHLLAEPGDKPFDIYGENARLEFAVRLRDERKFNSADDLVEQIRKDILEGERRLS
jgi:riboflavin kinase/FMN adenylyltransferase